MVPSFPDSKAILSQKPAHYRIRSIAIHAHNLCILRVTSFYADNRIIFCHYVANAEKNMYRQTNTFVLCSSHTPTYHLNNNALFSSYLKQSWIGESDRVKVFSLFLSFFFSLKKVCNKSTAKAMGRKSERQREIFLRKSRKRHSFLFFHTRYFTTLHEQFFPFLFLVWKLKKSSSGCCVVFVSFLFFP